MVTEIETPAALYTEAFAPAKPTPRCEIIAALKTITPLEGLSDEEYAWLADNGTERTGESGAIVFREGEPACNMNFILKGEIHVRRRHSGPMAFFVGRAGAMTGLLPFSRMKTYGGEGYTSGPVWVLDIHSRQFPAMLEAIPSMGQRSVTVLLDRVREVTRMEQQSEKLAALGKLAANLAHELNNPASAAQRSAASLFTELREYGDRKYRMGTLCLDREQSQKMQQWVERTRAEMSAYRRPSEDGPLALADREAEVTTWLDAHNIPNAWNIAPALAETGLPLRVLEEFAEEFDGEILAAAMDNFASSLRVERMAETIVGSTVRIFDLISAIKDYSYMDQAPIQEVDLAQSLENTLSMFRSRLQGITVLTDFDPALPPISAYGSELSQVWTALIENALDAMPNGGRLNLKTKLAGLMAVVEVWDSGAGIEPDLQTRVFEPFFTTKAPGSGLGLGLDQAQRVVSKHSGFLTVVSKPGETCFQVRLPLDQAQAY
ncbi:ATP-binding protein [Granulicella tundricola]|uniref:histidine kinase n=1 Tax=Granulicella tundricola (strain ATCC BAA-1859 / DSM 23138 / MP5ACTX9) TaxID=1198114 RepID=E8WXU7_GRATM|nr:ATP-binding protein [Granulicella tundricola]ADW69792.1 histidine kinase [Granulicella tundricola MP5ACTX9]